MKARIARFAVRPGGESLLILGLTHPDVFKAGHLYEVVEVDGEHVIRDLGESAAKRERDGCAWSRDASSLVMDGRHLYTEDELVRRERIRDQDGHWCTGCGHEKHQGRVCGQEDTNWTCHCKGDQP